ncbi:MAG: serine/threonine-protein kinase PknK [Bradymonadaceae bacterium]
MIDPQTSMWLGPFELVESIARGGMAEVFRARMPGESVDIALKVMTSDLAQNDYSREQFRREVQAMAQLTHPAIAMVYDLGEVGEGESHASDGRLPEGAPWLAMEYVDGQSLGEYLDPVRWASLEPVVLQLLDALAHAHADGIIHRDLKPSNVLVEPGDEEVGQVKLVDFGIAHIVTPGREEEASEREGKVTGTPAYMAPEQILGKRRQQGPWTDLYAVGCLVWRIVCGATPFEDADSEEVLAGHVEHQLPAFDPHVPVPAGLEDWLRRMLRKRPDARFRRAADAAYGLLQLAERDRRREPADESREIIERPEAQTTLVALDQTIRETGPELRRSDGLDPTDLELEPLGAGERTWGSPPVPDSWKREESVRAEIPVRGAGVNLFGLRKIPMVDRDGERDRLWKALRVTTAEQSPRAVIVNGPPGCGKSRLAEWIAHRAHETGAANVFQAYCSPTEGQGPREGLGPMLARYFRTYGLPYEQIRELLERQFERLGAGGPSVYHDAAGLARMMARADAGEGVPREAFESAEARNAALVRLMRQVGHERTALLVFDDVQWAGASLEFISHLLANQHASMPVLIVMTVGWEEMSMPTDNQELIGRISEADRAEQLSLGPLEDADQLQLVQQLLGLDPALAREVAGRTGGNPLFAIQLVSDWIERRALIRSSGGFDLRESGEADVPEDIGDLWRLRLERLIASLPDGATEDARMRLELAATLGDSVRRDEWKRACQRRGVPLPDDSPLTDTMFRRGFAERTRDGWAFTHEMFRQRILEGAEREDRKIANHAVCAATLAEMYSAQALGVPLRIARHLLAAGESVEALPYIDRAIWQALDSGRNDRAGELIARHREIAERLDGDRGERARLRNEILGSHLLVERGRGDRIDWEAHPIETAQLYRALGLIERDRGNLEEAREAYQKATEWFEAGGFYSHQAGQLSSIGYTWLIDGALERAEDAFKRALELARLCGNRSVEASAWNLLGELARRRAAWDEARRCYQNALDVYRDIENYNTNIPKANLALVELAAGNWAEARRMLEPLIERLPELGLDVWTSSLRLALACVDVAEGHLEQANERARSARDALDDVMTANPDTAWLGETLGDLASNAGDMQCAQIGWKIARDQWKRLENFDMAEELDNRLPSSETSRVSTVF